MLTRRGQLAVALAVVLLLAGRLLGVTELFGLAVAALTVVAAGVLRVRAPQLRVALSAKVVPPAISLGEFATIELSVENTGSVPTPPGRLSLVPTGGVDGPLVEVPRLVPGERATVSLRLPTERRGRHEVSGYEAVLGDAFGTCRRQLARLAPSRYGVRPLAEPLSGTLPSGAGGADGETTRSAAERLRSGASLLRPYLPGDDLRKVHWATTARVGELMVRQGGDREVDASSGVLVVLSPLVKPAAGPAAGHERFEEAVRVAASLLTAAEREGSFRLVVPGLADTGAGYGPRHLEALLEVLTDVEGRPFPGRAPAPLPSARGLEQWAAFFVAACRHRAELAELFGAEPGEWARPAALLIEVCAGTTASSLSHGERSVLEVDLGEGASLEALFSGGERPLVAP